MTEERNQRLIAGELMKMEGSLMSGPGPSQYTRSIG